MRYSAALLVKLTARALCFNYKQAKKENSDFIMAHSKAKEITPRQFEGDTWAEGQMVSLMREMGGGVYRPLGPKVDEEHTIHYSFDELIEKRNQFIFVEHKQPGIEDSDLDSYFQKAIIQVAFYASLYGISDRTLKTASYQTGERFRITHTKPHGSRFELNFGGDRYVVDVREPTRVLQFFFTKLKAAREWDSAQRFDDAYKGREWECYFSYYVSYRKSRRKK